MELAGPAKVRLRPAILLFAGAKALRAGKVARAIDILRAGYCQRVPCSEDLLDKRLVCRLHCSACPKAASALPHHFSAFHSIRVSCDPPKLTDRLWRRQQPDSKRPLAVVHKPMRGFRLWTFVVPTTGSQA